MGAVGSGVLILLCATALVFAQDAKVSVEDTPSSTGPTEASETPTPVSHIESLVALVNPPYGLYTTKREINLPAGKHSSLVATLTNVHEGTTLPRFTLDILEGSLRYPGFYDYHIQNFTKVRLQNTLEPGQEASIFYKFKPAVELAGRSFDLSIVAFYHDENGAFFAHPLFNQTVNLVEVEEGIDTELLFLGALVVSIAIAVLVGIWHWCTSKVTKRPVAKAKKIDEPVEEKEVGNEYALLLEKAKALNAERAAHRRHGKR